MPTTSAHNRAFITLLIARYGQYTVTAAQAAWSTLPVPFDGYHGSLENVCRALHGHIRHDEDEGCSSRSASFEDERAELEGDALADEAARVAAKIRELEAAADWAAGTRYLSPAIAHELGELRDYHDALSALYECVIA
jgi:hypothetical protein